MVENSENLDLSKKLRGPSGLSSAVSNRERQSNAERRQKGINEKQGYGSSVRPLIALVQAAKADKGVGHTYLMEALQLSPAPYFRLIDGKTDANNLTGFRLRFLANFCGISYLKAMRICGLLEAKDLVSHSCFSEVLTPEEAYFELVKDPFFTLFAPTLDEWNAAPEWARHAIIGQHNQMSKLRVSDSPTKAIRVRLPSPHRKT